MSAILDLPEMRARVRRWTVAEYEKLGDGPAFRRTELIRGLIVNKMPKSPLRSNATTRFYAYLIKEAAPGVRRAAGAALAAGRLHAGAGRFGHPDPRR